MSNVRVRVATTADGDRIARCNAAMALETEGLRLDPQTARRGVRAVLEDPGKGFYLLAERDDEVVGQLMITFEWSDWRAGWFWWLQSVYVEPRARRLGVFRTMMNEVERLACERGSVVGTRLYVEANNHRAQATYASVGMTHAHYVMYEKIGTGA